MIDGGCAAALPFTRDIVRLSVKGLDIVRRRSRGRTEIDLTEVESASQGVRTARASSEQDLAAARAADALDDR